MERGKLNFMINEVKLFLHFGSVDMIRLKKIQPFVKPQIPRIVDYVLKRIGTNPKLVSVLENHPLPLEAARSVFENWLDEIFNTSYDTDYAQRLYDVTAGHEKAGINPMYITMTMSLFIMVMDYIFNGAIKEKEMIHAYSYSMKKALFLNLILMTQSYEEIKRGKILKSLDHV